MLMQRAYHLDVLVCPRCSGPMRMVAVITDERVAGKILRHLGLPTRSPPRGRPWNPQRALALERHADDLDAIDPPSTVE